MKRGGPLKRKTALKAKTRLKAKAGIKPVLDNLADMNVLLHDGPSQLSELDRVWQVPTP